MCGATSAIFALLHPYMPLLTLQFPPNSLLPHTNLIRCNCHPHTCLPAASRPPSATFPHTSIPILPLIPSLPSLLSLPPLPAYYPTLFFQHAASLPFPLRSSHLPPNPHFLSLLLHLPSFPPSPRCPALTYPSSFISVPPSISPAPPIPYPDLPPSPCNLRAQMAR